MLVVCSVGIDMVAIPGSVDGDTIAAKRIETIRFAVRLLKWVVVPRAAVVVQDQFLIEVFNGSVLLVCFLQRGGWLGGDPRFLADLWHTYGRAGCRTNSFVDEWLEGGRVQ